ncbi:hypothetical protein PSHT_07907, partial [Puccinia striiformis]
KQTKLGSPPKGYTPANTYDRRDRPLDLYQPTTHRRADNIYDHVKCYRPKKKFQRATQIQAKDQQVNFQYSDKQEPQDHNFHLELLDQQRDSAVNFLVMNKEMTRVHHLEAHSDAEEGETLNEDKSEWDRRSDLDIMADSNHFHPLPNNNVLDSPHHSISDKLYEYGNHSNYNDNHDSTSNNHHDYTGDQAEDLSDQQSEHGPGCDLYDEGEDNYHGGEDYYDGGEDYYDRGEDYHEDREDNYDGEDNYDAS